MIYKKENSDEEFLNNIKKIEDIFKNNSNYLFYFSYDPDAIGASIALALYLKNILKSECLIFISKETDFTNVKFLFDICAFNKIKVVFDGNEVFKFIVEKKPAVITIDTPNSRLLPEFVRISELIKSNNVTDIIEIDHHFGGDSEQIFEGSVPVFRQSNSSCELIAILLEETGKKNDSKMWLDKAFPRNIIVSLLVGIIFDTQNGKFIYDKDEFKHWHKFLSDRLKWLTWGNPKNIRDAENILETLNKLNKKEKSIIVELIKKIKRINNTGLLFIEPSGEGSIFNYKGFGSSALTKIINDLVNRVPEHTEGVGIVSYFDKTADQYLIKIRRASKFKKIDLRKIEDVIKEIFDGSFIGGGGHEGATSFRIFKIDKDEFLSKLEILHKRISGMM